MIESIIGGRGNDLLIGNDSSNVLDGGAGIDTVQLAERQSAHHLSQSSDGFAITTNTRLANEDKLVNIERLIWLVMRDRLPSYSTQFLALHR